MKKLILIAALLQPLLFFGQSDDDDLYRNAVTITPIAFLRSGIQLGYERNIGYYNGLKLEAGYFTKDDPLSYDASSMSGFSAQLFYKRYFNPLELREIRFYFGAMGIYKQIALTDVNSTNSSDDVYMYSSYGDISVNAYGGGIIFGGNVFFENHFYMDYSIGGTVLATDSDPADVDEVHIGIINPYKRGITPRLNIAVGYAF